MFIEIFLKIFDSKKLSKTINFPLLFTDDGRLNIFNSIKKYIRYVNRSVESEVYNPITKGETQHTSDEKKPVFLASSMIIQAKNTSDKKSTYVNNTIPLYFVNSPQLVKFIALNSLHSAEATLVPGARIPIIMK